jgi:ATP-dependent helicase/nuclease subunit B
LRYGFQPTPLWEFEKKELCRILRVYLTWECTENRGRFHPHLQEAQFGTKGADKQAYRIQMDENYLFLRGVIDRIDRDETGNLQVIDYKSGSSFYTKDNIIKAMALQTALYALAAEYLWAHEGESVVKSEYRHLPARKSSGSLSFKDGVIENELVYQAIFQVFKHIQRIKQGVFPSATEKSIRGTHACTNYCDYAPLCRVSRQLISKARKAGLK